MKKHLDKYCDDNDIILKNHHSGLKGQSTMTARAVIKTKVEKNFQNNCLVGAAYNTVDQKILLMKLEYYKVEGRELALFTSYLHNRKQYTDINTKESVTINCLPCRVVQGSKLSRLLYTI